MVPKIATVLPYVWGTNHTLQLAFPLFSDD